MRIDLRNDSLYDAEEVNLPNKITYVFGKNGTGKSTFTKLIKEQYSNDRDVRIFQGFSSVIGSNEKLDAVALGEENTEIQNRIEEISKEIDSLESAKADAEKKILQPLDKNIENLWTKAKVIRDDLSKAENKISKFSTDAAKEIKTRSNPTIAIPTYNKSYFLKDIENAVFISDTEREQCKKTLLSENKIAPSISFPTFELDKIVDCVNSILTRKVEEKIIVGRLEGNSEKQSFARLGVRIHKPGDICAFCGNKISNEVFEELGSYFSADETKGFQEDIDKCIKALENKKRELGSISISETSFYPEYSADVVDLKAKYLEAVIGYSKIVDSLIEKLQIKHGHLFEEMDKYVVEEDKIPLYKIIEFDCSYRDLVSKNNKADLKRAQKEAQEKLRLDAVANILKTKNYESLNKQKDDLQRKQEVINADIREVEKNIDNIENDIKRLRKEIVDLQNQTRSERKLADNINIKLRALVDFELEYYEDYDRKGYYRIKDIETGEHRPVTQLSTGEKNIIAFLYFVEKLDEIGKGASDRSRIIVFDDPMSSNDDTMMYLLVDQLQDVISHVQESNDTMVILTHNVSFFMDVKRSYKDSFYVENTVLRFEKKNGKTIIVKVNNKAEDVKSSYGNLWVELKNLYESDNVSADTMLNTMRRIIECFTDFIGRNKYKFCEKVPAFMSVLNAGSHANTELKPFSGSKQDALKMFCMCFKDHGAFNHVKYYWGGQISELVGIE